MMAESLPVRRHSRWWMAAALSPLILTGCPLFDTLSDRLGECHDTAVMLVNSEQTMGAVHVLVDDELATPESRLESGEARSVTMCLERGRGYRFRAESDTGHLETVKCPASQVRYENEHPSVVWTPVGFLCADW